MDGRGFGSGYSNWGGGGAGGGGGGGGGGGNRGSGGYDSMSGLGGYGGGGHMKRCLTGADAVIAKINQRLDMLTQLEGGFKGSRCDRFDQYESFDSRPSSFSSSRDLYRSGGSNYGFGDGREDDMPVGQRGGSGFGEGFGLGGGGGFGSPSSSYGVAKMRPNMRESFPSGPGGGSGGGGGGWVGAGRRSPRRGGSGGVRGAGGGYGSRRPDPTPMGGGGRGGGGRGKLPSLLSNRMYPESGGFHQGSIQGPQDFPGRHFGGGPRAGRQRGRKRPLNKVKPQREMQRKRRPSLTGEDEPESKMNRMEDAAGEDPDGTPMENPQQTEKNGDNGEANAEPKETNPAEDAEKDSTEPEEKKVQQVKQLPGQSQDKHPKMRKRRGFLERVMFACSVCKFRSFYKEEMEAHLESRFHKDHFKFLSGQLSKPTTDFLQEYLQNKFKKTEQRVSQMENHSAAICQMYREQDLTKELSMEHFMRKVEAAHCAACDLFIPMQPHLIQKHIKSPDHNYNRKGMMEQSKRASLSVARSILNHKLIGKKLESYLKGENPFIGNQDDQDAEDTMVMEGAEQELNSEAADGETADAPVQPEGEVGQEVFEGEAPAAAAAAAAGEDEEKMEDQQGAQGDVMEEGYEAAAVEEEGEQQQQQEEQQQQQEEEEQQQEQDELHENQEEDEGFEIGGEEEGYVVEDEVCEEGLHGELEDEGLEVAEEEEKNDE